ncbi:hypothetical protein ACOCEA_17980 [Maribacter sp. CXY002]|uniref:hypothetical protein n=1 Tax=Maribacter luteocoastalis TaxID=3407671 RepID=UPI003B6847FB
MNQKSYLIILLFLGFYSCEHFSQKDYFDNIVYKAYNTRYDGLVVEKYIDAKDHNRNILIIENNLFEKNKTDFTFQSLRLFDFIKIGDTIFKERKSITLNIKRVGLDTLINLDFGNIKGHEEYYWENPYLNKEKTKDSLNQ